MNDPAFVIWFTGLSGSGKSTIAQALDAEFASRELNFEVLDGDVVRQFERLSNQGDNAGHGLGA